jgi:uncharacterized peroxidase-related enzyme
MKSPWIRVISFEEARDHLREIYEDTLRKRGNLAEVHKIHSLNPESLTAHMDLYLTLMYGKSPLPRREREMIGVVVSAVNSCPYCVVHHSDALSVYEKRDDYLKAIQDMQWEDLDEKDQRICIFAESLTLQPWELIEEDLNPLRDIGLSDHAILDIVQIVSYFNFVNRIVLGLGVPIERPDEREGYKY